MKKQTNYDAIDKIVKAGLEAYEVGLQERSAGKPLNHELYEDQLLQREYKQGWKYQDYIIDSLNK